MKLKFDANQQYQLDAIKSVVDVFDGRPASSDGLKFEIYKADDGFDFAEYGFANQMLIDDDQIAENTEVIQKRNGIPKEMREDPGEQPFPEFTIEMETGTGKTYVYLRSIHELIQKYGFQKFVIVVPSVAIREGVLKNLQVTSEHFENLYGKTSLDYFEYDSSRLGQLRNFATTDTPQIMIINIDSFNKDKNIMNRPNDQMSGRTPLSFIQQTQPVVIMDEPQNMETKTAKEAIASLNPLCTFRYSATHRSHPNLLYRLDPVDAYKMGLVKQIEVSSVVETDNVNHAYISVENIEKKSKGLGATLEIQKDDGGTVRTGKKTVYVGDDLFDASNGREVYKNNFTVEAIDIERGLIEFGNRVILEEGEVHGGMSEDVMKTQIDETVKAHLEKELELREYGIKVLSLFFIDKVANYRIYNDGPESHEPGKIAKWFEEAYEDYRKQSRYGDLNLPEAEFVHDGYFAKDSKGRIKDSHSGEAKTDVDAYELIMKDKERLLSFDEPLKFIFSHSALREGWDNPNVFQICTLNETKSEIKKRQEIGRGVRIPVNQDGERVFDNDLNVLTVVANEFYEDFAKQLQSEIQEDFGLSSGDVSGHVKNKKDRKKAKLKKGYKLDENFKELWNRIKHKTRYNVDFDTEKFVESAAEAVGGMSPIREARIKITNVRITTTGEGGELGTELKREGERRGSTKDIAIPDLLQSIQGSVKLTRSTIAEILVKSGRLEDATVNPQRFIEKVSATIEREMENAMVEGVKYEKIGGNAYEMKSFETNDLWVYLKDKNTHKVKNLERTVFDHYQLDSGLEKEFIQKLETDEKVEFYVKLPSWFTIDTPLGTYNPDWGIVFDGEDKLYFVAESKSTRVERKLRPEAMMKIECGKKHFDQLDGVEFKGPVTTPGEVVE
jgi:type III restriction enzyme